MNPNKFVDTHESRRVVVDLSAAQIAALKGTPVQLIPAPAVNGRIVVVDEIQILNKYGTTTYATGDDLVIRYKTSAVTIATIDKAVVTAAAKASWILRPDAAVSGATSVGIVTTASANKAVEIVNSGGAEYNTGDGSLKIAITYRIVEVLA